MRARWRAVFALAGAETVSWGILYYSFGVLLPFLAAELGASNATVGGAFSAALLAGAAVSRTSGRLIDRVGPAPVMTAAGLLGALAFALLHVTSSVDALYAIWIVVGVSHAGVLYEPAFAAATTWFPSPAARTRALLVITTFGGLASTIFLPLTAWLCARLGWRDAVLVLAATLVVLTLPVHATLPRAATVAPVAGSRVPRLHRLASLSALQSFVSAGVALFLVVHLHAEGMSIARAAALAGLMGAAQLPGRLLFAPLSRHAAARWRLPGLLAAQGVALAGIATQAGGARVLCVVLFGAANGLVTLERATLIVERAGPAGFGAASGRVASVALVGRAAGPLGLGLLAAATGTTGAAFLLLAAVLLGAALQAGWTQEQSVQPAAAQAPHVVATLRRSASRARKTRTAALPLEIASSAASSFTATPSTSTRWRARAYSALSSRARRATQAQTFGGGSGGSSSVGISLASRSSARSEAPRRRWWSTMLLRRIR